MALAEITIVPIGTPTSSIGDWIADAVRVLEKEDVRYVLSPTGTLIEGEIGDIFKLAGLMHEAGMKRGIKRVITTMLVDDRRDKDVTMESKIESVKARLKA